MMKSIFTIAVLRAVLSLTPLMVQTQTVFPQRIVSLAPSLTEAVCLLGAEARLVGITSYCSRPASVIGKEIVATAVNVNIEKALMLKPDLVLTTKLTALKDVRALERLGIHVEIFEQPLTFDLMCRDFLRLGEMIGQADLAEAIVSEAIVRSTVLEEKIADLPRKKAVVQIGARPLFVATGESFLSDMLRMAGGLNPAESWPSGLVSREKILAESPQCLFIVTMGVAAEEERKTWLQFANLPAAQQRAVYILDSYLYCSPSPLTFVEALKEMAFLLHGVEDASW